MAVFTHLSDAEIAEAVRAFAVGELVAAHPIAQGVENSNWKLELRTSSAVLLTIFTLFEKRTRAEDLPFFIGLMRHLASRGVACPAPYATAQGECLIEVRGRKAVMVSFLQGENMAQQSVPLLYSLGEAMAGMHLAASDFEMKRVNDLSLQGWQGLAEKLGAKLDTITPGLHALVQDELAFQASQWPEDLPRGIIHADLFRDNVMVEHDRVVGLFDFYFACTDALVYELAICLNCWCFDGEGHFHREWADAMLEGYQSVRPLSPAEQAALPQLARGAALRFLLTRAHDWIHHPADALVVPKDPMEYVGYLTFFRE